MTSPALDVRASFCNSQAWNTHYTRTRHRNVRCFPTCATPFHKARSFCGNTISLNLNVPIADVTGDIISQDRIEQYHVYCCFRSLRHPLWLSVGETCSVKSIASSDEDFVRAQFVSFDYETRCAVFEIRPPRKWQYNVQRDTPASLYSKAFDSDEHCFAAFVVDCIPSVCVGQCDSPAFHIVSAWKRETSGNSLTDHTGEQQQQQEEDINNRNKLKNKSSKNKNCVRIQKREHEATASVAKRRAVAEGSDGRWSRMCNISQQQQQQQPSFIRGGVAAFSNPFLNAFLSSTYREWLASVTPTMAMYPAHHQLGFGDFSLPPPLSATVHTNTLPPNYLSARTPFMLPAAQHCMPLLNNKSLLPFTSSLVAASSAMITPIGVMSFSQPNSGAPSRRGSVSSQHSSTRLLFQTPSSSPSPLPSPPGSSVVGNNHLNFRGKYRDEDNASTSTTTPSSVSPQSNE